MSSSARQTCSRPLRNSALRSTRVAPLRSPPPGEASGRRHTRFSSGDVRSGERPGICPYIPGNIRNDILHSDLAA